MVLIISNRFFNGKEVKFLPYKRKLYFTIINHIKLHGKLPKLSISKQAMQHYIKKLKIDDIIYKIGYGTWGVNEDKAEQFLFLEKVKILSKGSRQHLTQNFTSLKDKRGHGFIISFLIPKIAGWHKRKEFFKNKGIETKDVGIHNSGIRIIVRDFKCHLYKNKIVIYSPSHRSYFSDTAKESYKYAIYDMQQILKQIENIMGVSFKINGTYKFKVSRQHYAKINDNLAKMCKRNGEKLLIGNENGTWLIADNSLNLDELETVHQKTAQTDMDNVVAPFFNDLKEYYEKTGETAKMSDLIKLHTAFAYNIETHISAIKQLGNAVEILTQKVEQLGGKYGTNQRTN